MTKKCALALNLTIVTLLLTGCVKKHFISWADITLRNYRDIPGLKISADEWKRSAKIFLEEKDKNKIEWYESRRLFCEGKALQKVGQDQKALVLFRQAAETDPQWPLPYEAIGSIELESGNFEDARTMFKKACSLDPMWTSPLSDLGVACHHLGEPLKALQSFDKAIQIDSSHGYLHSNRGNILTTLGRFDEAIKSHLEAITLEPQNPIFYLNMSATLEEINDLENQLWVQEKLKDILPESQKLIVILKIARLLDDMGRSEEALAEYKKALEMRPDKASVKKEVKKFYFSHKLFAHLIDFIIEDSPANCEKCAQECYDIGNILLRNNNLDGALKSYQAAITLDPDLLEPYHNLGIVHYKKHNYQMAVKYFRIVLEREAEDVSAILNTGMAYYRMGKAKKAIEWVEKAIHLKEDIAIAHSNLGEILRSQGKYKKAKKEHEKAVSLDPGNCYILAQYLKLLVNMKKIKEVEEEIKGSSTEQCASLFMVRAIVLVTKKDYDKALKEINKALALDKSIAEAIAVRSLIHSKQGNKDKAEEDLMTAMCMEKRLGQEKIFKSVKINKNFNCGGD